LELMMDTSASSATWEVMWRRLCRRIERGEVAAGTGVCFLTLRCWAQEPQEEVLGQEGAASSRPALGAIEVRRHPYVCLMSR
jgi:hypothetical protein